VMAVPFLGVDFEFRRQGLGKQLMDVAREVAQQAKVKLLCLTIAEHNQAAQAFYSQYGFKEQQLVARGDSTRHVLYTMKPGSGDSSKAQGQ
ncbi:N-acetyltransferase domain-containing protein, partial [Haematococcus lacustris]